MKIVLVLPDQTKLDELKGWWYPPPAKRNRKMSLPSLGMLYLCAAVKADHDAVYIDNALERLSDEQLAAKIIGLQPDVVGFGGTNQEWPQASTVAALVKKACPSAITIYGGPNATARPEKHIHYFDYVFRGTAELTLKAFLDRLEQKQSPVGIDGLCAKTFDAIAAPAIIQDLDALPWPDRSRIDLNAYQRESHGMPAPVDVVVTSRGCPYDCRFCSAQFIWNRRYLKRSAESVLDEIRFMTEAYGTRSLHFREDNLTVDRDRLRRLCEGLANMGLKWTCRSRINSLNEDIVRMMKDCGCTLISCGFESVNDATLKYLRKRQTAAQIFTIIDIFERVGMHYTGGFIVASPNETRQEIINTVRFAQELSTFPHSRIPPTPLRFVGIPASELYYKIIEDGLVEYDWQDGELLFPRTYAMSSAAIDDLLAETCAGGSSRSEDDDAAEVIETTKPIELHSVSESSIDEPTPQMQLYEYKRSDGSFDYDRYRQVQIEANKRKLHKVWVQEDNIRFLSEYIKSHVDRPSFGLCHGTRRGKEQEWFRKYVGCEVLGTEISDTAAQFPYTLQWDFHEVKPEWINAVDFIYSNSFDHSYDPDKCLNAWMSCLKEGGVCILEHTSGHEVVTESDPFGASLSQMKEMIHQWGSGRFDVHEILQAPVCKQGVNYTVFIVIKHIPRFQKSESLDRPIPDHTRSLGKLTSLVSTRNELANQVCVIIRSIGERTEGLCRRLLSLQVPEQSIFVIHKTPFTEALRETYRMGLKSGCRWTVVIDADLLVRPRAIEQVLNVAERLDKSVFCWIGLMIDKFIENPKPRVGGVHLYATRLFAEALQMIPAPEQAIRPESFVLQQMKKKGFPYELGNSVMAYHDYEQYYRDIYRKCFVHARKNLELVQRSLNDWKKHVEQDADFIVAMAGFLDGLKHSENVAIDAKASWLSQFQNVLQKYNLKEKTLIGHDFIWREPVVCLSHPDQASERDNMDFKNKEMVYKKAPVSAFDTAPKPSASYFPKGDAKEEMHVGDGDKHKVLEWMHQLFEPKCYFEIGVQTGKSLSLARCRAIGVDPAPQIQCALSGQVQIYPMSSDDFFAQKAQTALSVRPDFVFIDGMHLLEYVLRDFINVERYSLPWTIVVIDDIFPAHPSQAKRERTTRTWTGDVWKIYDVLKKYRPDLYLLPLNASPTGLLMVAGLDAKNTILSDRYAELLNAYRHSDPPPASILHRYGVFSSFDSQIFNLVKRLRQARVANYNCLETAKLLRTFVSSTVSNDTKISCSTSLQNGVSSKKAIYTAITGNYDHLQPPKCPSAGWDYVCFTDNPEMSVEGWQIRLLPEIGLNLPRLSRLPKLLPHLVLPEYEQSVWVDANFEICGDLGELAQRVLRQHYLVFFKHPENRSSIYEEAIACMERQKESPERIVAQMEHYAAEGLPAFSIPACGVIFRRHHHCPLKVAMEAWWRQFCQFTCRDQLSFAYISWKYGLSYDVIEENIRHNSYLRWTPHNRQALQADTSQLVCSKS